MVLATWPLLPITVLVLFFDATQKALAANRTHPDHPVRCGTDGHAERPGLAQIGS